MVWWACTWFWRFLVKWGYTEFSQMGRHRDERSRKVDANDTDFKTTNFFLSRSLLKHTHTQYSTIIHPLYFSTTNHVVHRHLVTTRNHLQWVLTRNSTITINNVMILPQSFRCIWMCADCLSVSVFSDFLSSLKLNYFSSLLYDPSYLTCDRNAVKRTAKARAKPEFMTFNQTLVSI